MSCYSFFQNPSAPLTSTRQRPHHDCKPRECALLPSPVISSCACSPASPCHLFLCSGILCQGSLLTSSSAHWACSYFFLITIPEPEHFLQPPFETPWLRGHLPCSLTFYRALFMCYLDSLPKRATYQTTTLHLDHHVQAHALYFPTLIKMSSSSLELRGGVMSFKTSNN